MERETIERLEISEKAKVLRQKQLQQEAKLATQLEKIKLEEQRKERLRHLLKETRSSAFQCVTSESVGVWGGLLWR